ncbi:hypothetical protein [Limnospira fusiformis]|uniref:Secreted protein n=3 Tax=Limnospira TaxID=2596745 RepID=A0ABU9EKQ7_LIMFS
MKRSRAQLLQCTIVGWVKRSRAQLLQCTIVGWVKRRETQLSHCRLGEAQRNPTSPAVINQVSVKKPVNFPHLW